MAWTLVITAHQQANHKGLVPSIVHIPLFTFLTQYQYALNEITPKSFPLFLMLPNVAYLLHKPLNLHRQYHQSRKQADKQKMECQIVDSQKFYPRQLTSLNSNRKQEKQELIANGHNS